MNFSHSSQKHLWMLSKQELASRREASRARCCAAINAANNPQLTADSALTQTEERALLDYHITNITKVGATLGFNPNVTSAACMLYRRFYVSYSAMEYDPLVIMVTSIYLACKAEESYVSVSELSKHLRVKEKAVLDLEAVLLEGVQFCIITHSAARALPGLLRYLTKLSEANQLEPALNELTRQQIASVSAQAYQYGVNLLRTDAQFQYAPSLLGLACIKKALHKQGLGCGSLLSRIADGGVVDSQSQGYEGGEQSVQGAECFTRIKEVISDIETLIYEGSKQVDKEQVSAYDRKLKACRVVTSKDRNNKQDKQKKAKSGKQKKDEHDKLAQNNIDVGRAGLQPKTKKQKV